VKSTTCTNSPAAHRTLPFETMVRVHEFSTTARPLPCASRTAARSWDKPHHRSLPKPAAREIESIGPVASVPVRIEVLGKRGCHSGAFFTVQVGAFPRSRQRRAPGATAWASSYSPIFIQQYDSSDGPVSIVCESAGFPGKQAAAGFSGEKAPRPSEGFSPMVIRPRWKKVPFRS